MVTKNHPAPELLSDYALGRLLDDDLDAVAEHVEQCGPCQQTLSHLHMADDTLVRGLAGRPPETPFGEEPELAAALAAIRQVSAEPDAEATQNLDRPASLSACDAQPLGTLRDYDLLAPLGQGGMGTVYRARHLRLDRLVAVKVLPAERMRQPEAIARFHREMKAVGNLDHPNIVRAHDAGEVDGKHFLVMELVDGVDLSALAEREGPLPAADACELVRQAAVGLDHAHRNGLVHRDVKPSNLMLDHKGVVKVLDLGLARLLAEPASGDDLPPPEGASAAEISGGHFQAIASELTGADQVMGTPDYMAPEQCTNCRAVDARSDVYSLGATLYRLLAGQSPYSGAKYDTLAKKIAGLTHDPAPPITNYRSDLPAALVALIERLLAKRPEERPATPAEVAEALAPFCRGHRLLALARGGADDAAEQGGAVPNVLPSADRRRPPLRWAIAAAALACLGGVGVVIARISTPQGELTIDVPRDIADTVKVDVQGNGESFRVSAAEGWSIALKDGVWQVALADSRDRFQLDRQTVTIRRGETEKVRVTQKPNQAAAKSKIKTAGAPPKKADRPRYHLGETATTRLAELLVRNPANNHYYLRHNNPMSWRDAKRFCEGQGGRLATITSAEENAFIYKHFAQDQACWLGATDEANEGAWKWSTGEPFDYKNWFRDEPSNSAGGEHFLAIGNRYENSGGIHYRYDGYWNDLADKGMESGLQFVLPLCEWEPDNVPANIARRAQPAALEKETVIARFHPPTPDDDPIAKDAVRDDDAGEGVWRYRTDETRTFRLHEIENPSVEDCILAYRASMKTENVEGQAYLEMWCRFPGVGESFSKGYHHAMKGTNDWAQCEAPFFLQKDQRPDLIKLNLVIEGKGTVWLRDIELLASPLPDAMKALDK